MFGRMNRVGRAGSRPFFGCTMLTVADVADRLNVSPGLVYAWVQAGVLPHYRMGRPGRKGAIRFSEADLDAYLAGQKRETGPRVVPPAPKSQFRHINVN